ncbi:MAG: TonB-dependent receptor plug domain-containing protein [Gemmatimonadota bacterium]|nr:TonB-dependent receptor plug domain-containing protein [Gemmatimonadota bacterium]
MNFRYHPTQGARPLSLLAVVAAMAFLLPAQVAAQDGSVTGQVTAATTGQPINGAQVTIMDTQLGVLSNASGRFLINNVPSGTLTVQVVYVGYGTATQEVSVPPGGAATADFALEVSAVAMDELIVTGTAGAVERRKLGTSAASLNVADVNEAVPLEGIGHALEGRIPGVRSVGVVGGVGATRELRIRGTDSFSLGQRPVIYIDGIRVDNSGGEWGWMSQVTCCFFSGGAGEDRLSDLNPDEIDRVEVLKGPAASTLYGSEASGGVIQIFTKRGRSNSSANFSFSSSVGFNRHRENLPTSLRSNFRGPDGTVAFDPNETLIENGLINSYDLSVDGGGEEVTYFVSGGFAYEEGSIKPNDQKRANLRVNLNWTAAENLTVGVTSGYVRNRIWSLQSGNNWLGIYTNALLTNPLNATMDEPYGGGLDVNVEDAQAIGTWSDTDRWTGSVQLNYNPRPNFSHTAKLGLDAVADQKTRDLPFGRHYTYIGTLGERNIGYYQGRKFTADYTGNLDYSLPFMNDIAGNLAFGTQGYWDISSFSMATGKDFAGEGVTTVGGAARTFGDESFSEEVNVGFYVQNRFDIGDLFVTAAVRADGNSAFGENYGFQIYPKADVAYNLPTDMLPGLISSTKVRAAIGMAGKAPGAFAQFQTYVPSTVLDDLAGVSPFNPGNDLLEPENKLEYEAGIEMGLWNDRVGVDATYWNATTQNALLGIALPPSEGFSSSKLQNVGEILNKGVEVAVNATVLDRSSFRWSTGLNYEWTHNEILGLGETAIADSLPIYEGTELVGWTQHTRLGGFWVGFPISEIIRRTILGWDASSRSHIRSVYSVYQGQGFPDHLASLNNDFSIGQSFRFTIQFRGEWGASMVNSDRGYGVRQLAYDEYLMHLGPNGEDTPASDSVLNFHRLEYPVDSRDHIRLQEVSMSYTLPESLTSAIGLQRSSLTLSGYNLHWWDDCHCPDPNQQYRGGSSFNTSPFLGLPQPRQFRLTFRTRF